ncbi:uncharacterized protein [Dysidea avara]|uniref:uncharacterized protein isoform X2 n=1 Tax=Dysidea avara TaxID=196820 RepID=UPI003320521D
MDQDKKGIVRLGKPAYQVADANSFTEFLTQYSFLWNKIGLKLGLSRSVLENIQADIPKQVDRFERTLQDWLKLDGDSATWGVLELAMTNANRQYFELKPLLKLPLQLEAETVTNVNNTQQSSNGQNDTHLELSPAPLQPVIQTAVKDDGQTKEHSSQQQDGQLEKRVDLVKIPTIIRKSDPGDTNTISKIEPASAEFGVLLDEILEELMKNESKNLKLLKRTSSALTLKDKSGIKKFSDSELEDIYDCNDIETLLMNKLRHCYSWDDHSMLNVLMKKLNTKKCLNLLHSFEIEVCSKMKLQQLHEQLSVNILGGYYKMIAIVEKMFSDITKEEYDELKEFISQYCGVESYVMSPFSKVSPFNSVVIEGFIPVNAVSYMIETAKNNVHKFTEEDMFLYLKISSAVILDRRNNKSERYQLQKAAKGGDVVTLEKLINTRYIDVNTTDPSERTALHHATIMGQVQAIETLIRLGADVNALDKDGMTALHYAARKRRVQAIETLIRLGADVNALDKWGRTALHVAAFSEGIQGIHDADFSRGVQAIETLIRSGADVNALDEGRRTALHVAAYSGGVQAIETLIRSGVDVNALDEGRRTALHHAAERGQVQAIETLIRLGADVNALDVGRRTALHHAAERGQVQAIETLIRLGADVNALDVKGRTALHEAVNHGKVRAIQTLISLGADVNALDRDNFTPLLLALQRGNRDAVQFLVKEAKVDATQLDQSTQSKIKEMLGHNWSSGYSSDLSTQEEEQIQKEQEQFIKSSDDDGGKVVDTNTRSSRRCILM